MSNRVVGLERCHNDAFPWAVYLANPRPVVLRKATA